jgi:hypothetical protein
MDAGQDCVSQIICLFVYLTTPTVLNNLYNLEGTTIAKDELERMREEVVIIVKLAYYLP